MSAFWSSFPLVREGLGRVRARLQAQAGALPPELQAEVAPLFQREGKSLRAGLILLAAGPVDEGRRAKVDAAATAVELLHLATLVHDDIVDQAALRRGEPALYRLVGPQKAVLYGDLLLASVFRSVSRDLGPESSGALADLVTVMAVSEIQQLQDRYRLPLSPRRILRKTMGKTALLFSLSLYIGAREAGRDEATARWLRRAGYALGMAFQIQDDLLDWTATPGVLGKPVLEDLAAGIYTWPVALAWARHPERTEQELHDVKEGALTPAALRTRWAPLGYWGETQALVGRYADRARRDLDRALGPQSAERQEWERFIRALLQRRF